MTNMNKLQPIAPECQYLGDFSFDGLPTSFTAFSSVCGFSLTGETDDGGINPDPTLPVNWRFCYWELASGPMYEGLEAGGFPVGDLMSTGLWMTEKEAKVARQLTIDRTRQGLRGDPQLPDKRVWVVECDPDQWRMLLLFTDWADREVAE